MRVLLAAEQLRRQPTSGIATYTRGLVQGLPDVTLWASRTRRADPVEDLGRPVVTSPLPSRALVWAWDRGWQLAGAPDGFDVVHAPSLAVPPKPAKGVPLGVTVHDLAWRRVPETFPRRGRRWHEAALGRALARAAVLITPSTQTADDLLAAGAPAARVEVVAEGCDHLPPPDVAGAASLRARLGVRDEYLLTVSTLEPRKNLTRLMAAYTTARDRLPGQWPLIVVGPPGWGTDVRPQPGVVMAGPVMGAVLAGLYAGARVVAAVPLAEGFCLPAVEAMAAGVPLVASAVPSVGVAAEVVDPYDVDAIAAALVRVATDEGLRAELVAAGSQRAAALTWASAAARHNEIWESVRAGAGLP